MAQGNDRVVVAFDAYGTLLSTESIAKKLAEHVGQEKAQSIATNWRKYQLEYTWRLNSMGKWIDFSTITRRSAHHAMAEGGMSTAQQDSAIEDLMTAYDALSIFPDVESALNTVHKHPHIDTYVFSNGTSTMIDNSVHRSPDLSPHAHIFKDIVVVESTQRYKPAREVYDYLVERVGKTPAQRQSVWLVSGNPFDVTGARAAGINAAWVDRAGNGWQDGLIEGDEGRPTVMAKDLAALMDEIVKYNGL